MYKIFREIKRLLGTWLKARFMTWLRLPYLNHFCLFDGMFSEQCDGAAMG